MTNPKRTNLTFLFVLILCFIAHFKIVLAIEPSETVNYALDDPLRQKLNIYQAPGGELKPLYIWAHFRIQNTDPHTSIGINMAHNSIATGNMISDLNDAGITVISWGSYPNVQDNDEFYECVSDSFKMYNWVIANAESYGWDINNIVIGGNSRGSVVSWELFQSGLPGIVGGHFQQALPDSAWLQTDLWDPRDFVTPNSPPLYFAYAFPEGTTDNHPPEHGQKIMEAYEAQGIPNKANMDSDLGFTNMMNEIVSYCLDFIDPNETPNVLGDFYDDFEGSNTSHEWDIKNGVWTINEGTYLQSNRTLHSESINGNSNWTDYAFSVDVKTLNTFNQDVSWYVGALSFRRSDAQNKYLIRLTQSGTLLLQSVVNGSYSTIATKSTNLSPYDSHTFNIEVNGSSIRITVDGNLQIDIENEDHSVGNISLITTKATSEFDNVTVTDYTVIPDEPFSFADNFNNPNSLAENYTVLSGNWSIHPIWNNLRSNTNHSESLLLTGNSDWKDYTLSLKIKTTQQLNPGSSWQVARILFRYTNDQNYYEAMIRGNGVFSLQSVKNGVRKTLQWIQTESNPINQFLNVTISIHDAQITCELNGKSSETILNQDHQNGKVGFKTIQSKAVLDNLSINGH